MRLLSVFLLLSFSINVSFAAVLPPDYFQPSRMRVARDINPNIARNRLNELFAEECQRLAPTNNIIPVHRQNNHTVRVATYNVHFWVDVFDRNSFGRILGILQNINADILILQEVAWGPSMYNNLTVDEILDGFGNLGYSFSHFYQACQNIRGARFGNAIFSKYEFTELPGGGLYQVQHQPAIDRQQERRCYTHTIYRLPNNRSISIYGTHLDVYDNAGRIRAAQMQELTALAAHDQNNNVLIAGDFNEPQVAGGVVGHLHRANYVNCFERLRHPGPPFTVWVGDIIDFIFLSNRWQLPLQGAYVYFDSASDHIPVIFDFIVD